MNYEQIKVIYESQGITEYRLRSLQDLATNHGVEAEKVTGFNDLTNEHKELYKKFIVKFFNGQGLAARIDISPTGIYCVEEVVFLGHTQNSEEDSYTGLGTDVFVPKADGSRQLLKAIKVRKQ